MDDLANNPAEPELADAALEQAPADTEQPDTDQSDEPDLDTDGADPEFEEVELDDGFKVMAPKGQAEEARKRFLMQQDYTRKTQEAAEIRRQAEATLAQEREAIAAREANVQAVAVLTAMGERLKQFESIDWQQAIQQDPVWAQQKWIEYQQTKDAAEKAEKQIEQHKAQAAHRITAMMVQADEVLRREIPSWSTEYEDKLAHHAIERGARPEDLRGAKALPWVVKLMHDSYVLKQLQSKASKAPPPPPATPVKTVTGARSTATRDPDKMGPEEFAKWRNADLRKRGRL